MRVVAALVLLLAASSLHAHVRPGRRLTDAERTALVARREAIRSWAPRCPPDPGNDPTGGYSLYKNCTQGDVVAYAGATCLASVLAGDEETAEIVCQDVLESLDAEGRWRRGPMWRDADYPGGDFSRDQARGALAYQLAYGYISQDPAKRAEAKEAGERWRDYLMGPGDGKLCPDSSTSCGMRIGTQSLFRNVWRRVGILPPASSGSFARGIHRSRIYVPWGMRASVPLLRFETARGKWYPVHLRMLSVYLLRVCNLDPAQGFKKIDQKLARGLGSTAKALLKMQRENVFYRFMVHGITDEVVAEVMAKTSATDPMPIIGMHDWWLQRKWGVPDPNTGEMPWTRSDGWVDIFLINSILAKDAGRLNW
jgi:hypothetical protein